MGSCGAFCSFCGRCGKTVEKSFSGPRPTDAAPPGVSARSASTGSQQRATAEYAVGDVASDRNVPAKPNRDYRSSTIHNEGGDTLE